MLRIKAGKSGAMVEKRKRAELVTCARRCVHLGQSELRLRWCTLVDLDLDFRTENHPP